MIAFGPVPSRRLGRSLGINNIRSKVCSYDCIYCQLGGTYEQSIERQEFYSPESIYDETKAYLEAMKNRKENPDYITFVANGEPTLDVRLGDTLDRLKTLGHKIAVISNATFIDCEDVRKALLDADWVSLKIDAVEESVWKRVNRPIPGLSLDRILGNIRSFRKEFEGTFNTETMLIGGLNDDPGSISALADYLGDLTPDTAWISIPIRPPAEKWASAPDEKALRRIFRSLLDKGIRVRTLFGDEGLDFAGSEDLSGHILRIAAVHPLRKTVLKNMLHENGGTWDLVEEMVSSGRLLRKVYNGEEFYLKNRDFGRKG